MPSWYNIIGVLFVIHETILGEALALETAPGLFSPGHIDRGTLAMLGVAAFVRDYSHGTRAQGKACRRGSRADVLRICCREQPRHREGV